MPSARRRDGGWNGFDPWLAVNTDPEGTARRVSDVMRFSPGLPHTAALTRTSPRGRSEKIPKNPKQIQILNPLPHLDGPGSTWGWLLKEWRDQFEKRIRLGSDLLPNQLKRRASLKFHEGRTKKKNRSVSFIPQEGGGSPVGGLKKENSSIMLTRIFYTGEVRGGRLCIYI